jgi:hypothetical protein
MAATDEEYQGLPDELNQLHIQACLSALEEAVGEDWDVIVSPKKKRRAVDLAWFAEQENTIVQAYIDSDSATNTTTRSTPMEQVVVRSMAALLKEVINDPKRRVWALHNKQAMELTNERKSTQLDCSIVEYPPSLPRVAELKEQATQPLGMVKAEIEVKRFAQRDDARDANTAAADDVTSSIPIKVMFTTGCGNATTAKNHSKPKTLDSWCREFLDLEGPYVRISTFSSTIR